MAVSRPRTYRCARTLIRSAHGDFTAVHEPRATRHIHGRIACREQDRMRDVVGNARASHETGARIRLEQVGL